MKDLYEREIDYLRVSITDQCNLRCFYCMPKDEIKWQEAKEILSYEELEKLIGLAATLGIKKVRITGGEPLMRRNLTSFISKIAALPGIEDIAVTTNGILLMQKARELHQAGLSRVNISLDTLNGQVFKKITGFDRLDDVLQGIEQALSVGLNPVKINMVLLKGINETDALRLASWTKDRPIDVRFIELMPLGGAGREYFLPYQVIQDRIDAKEKLIPSNSGIGNGPAAYYRFPGAVGKVGFITPLSNHFCHCCNRVRLTADGRIKPCLMSPVELDVKQLLRAGASDEEIKAFFLQAVNEKPKQHHLEEEDYQGKRRMSQIGG